MNKLKIYCDNEDLTPKRVHPFDAGLDLKAKMDYTIPSGKLAKVHTGVYVEIPQGCVGLIMIRSGLSTQGFSLTNGVGVIDADYRGELICSIKYDSLYKPYKKIEQYERIAQLVVVPCFAGEDFEEYVDNLNDLSNTERGEGGFGHTGKR